MAADPPCYTRPVLTPGEFVGRVAERIRRPRPDVTQQALDWLVAQRWPGNVRELENAVERAVVLANGRVLGLEDFAPRGEARMPAASPNGAEYAFSRMSLDDLERMHIERILDMCSGAKSRAAAILGINRTTLWKKLRQYGME